MGCLDKDTEVGELQSHHDKSGCMDLAVMRVLGMSDGMVLLSVVHSG